LLAFELSVRSCPLRRDFISLLFNRWCGDFHSVWQRQCQKFENAFRCGSMACNDIFVIKDQRLDLVFAKIICPARFVGCDAVAPFVNYLEVKVRCGAWLRCDSPFLRPDARLACHGPGDSLLDSISSAHPDVFWPVEQFSQQPRSAESIVLSNFL